MNLRVLRAKRGFKAWSSSLAFLWTVVALAPNKHLPTQVSIGRAETCRSERCFEAERYQSRSLPFHETHSPDQAPACKTGGGTLPRTGRPCPFSRAFFPALDRHSKNPEPRCG